MFQVSIIQSGHLGIPATSCLESLDNVLNGNSNGIVIEKWSEMNCNKIQFKQLQDFNLKNVNPSVKQSSVRLSCSKSPAAWNQPLINCSTFSEEVFKLIFDRAFMIYCNDTPLRISCHRIQLLVVIKKFLFNWYFQFQHRYVHSCHICLRMCKKKSIEI